MEHWVGFSCPKCGGEHFGSVCDDSDKDYQILYRYCGDQFEVGCRWKGTTENEGMVAIDAPYDERAQFERRTALLRDVVAKFDDPLYVFAYPLIGIIKKELALDDD